jgi:hypothetical protein
VKARRPRADFVLSREISEAAAAVGRHSDVAACRGMRGTATRRLIRAEQYRLAMQHRAQGTSETASGCGAVLNAERSAPYAEGETRMNMREYAGDMYLKVSDLQSSGPRKVTIVAVEEGSFDKPVLRLDDNTLPSINATNAKVLIRAYGEESDDWTNKQIELYVGSTSYQGQPKDSILVRPISPAIPGNQRRPPKPPNGPSLIDDEIPF